MSAELVERFWGRVKKSDWLRQHDARLLREAKELATISVYHESGVRKAVGVDEMERRAREIEPEIGEKP